MIDAACAGSSGWDWITLGALFAAACFLLIGTLYINKQGRIRLSGMEASDFALHSPSPRISPSDTTSRRKARITLASPITISFYSIFRPAI